MKQTVIVTFNDSRPTRVFTDVERVESESYEHLETYQELSIRERDSDKFIISMKTVSRIEIIVEQD